MFTTPVILYSAHIDSYVEKESLGSRSLRGCPEDRGGRDIDPDRSHSVGASSRLIPGTFGSTTVRSPPASQFRGQRGESEV
jgi:hypothetical protein